MPTLKYRRLRGDLIETFKIINGIYDRDVTKGLLDLHLCTCRSKYKKEGERQKTEEKIQQTQHPEILFHKQNS